MEAVQLNVTDQESVRAARDEIGQKNGPMGQFFSDGNVPETGIRLW